MKNSRSRRQVEAALGDTGGFQGYRVCIVLNKEFSVKKRSQSDRFAFRAFIAVPSDASLKMISARFRIALCRP